MSKKSILSILILLSSNTILPAVDAWQNATEKESTTAQSPWTLRDSDTKSNSLEKNKEEKKEKYPLLKDVYHPKKEVKEYFKDIAIQLKKDHLDEDSIKGILLYGPPGTGKTETVEAIANESDSTLFQIKASELVTPYQGSGAQSIKDIFQAAKNKEVKSAIIFIDELQNLAPVTADKDVNFAHKYEGKDYQSALSHLWKEYDEINKNHDNILLVTACNEFELIEERVRERLECIEFPLPDQIGISEILRSKSDHFGLSISESELAEYSNKMKELSGRRLTHFIKKTKHYTKLGMPLKEALQQSLADQQKAINDAKPKEPSFMEKATGYAWESGKKIHDSALRALGFVMVVGAATLIFTGKNEKKNN